MNKKNKLICYNTDGSGKFGNASAVVFPKNVREVQNVIMESKDVVPRGGGNNIVGACIPNNSVVIDMKKMDKISFDVKTKTVYVDAGVTVRELNEKLKKVGFEFPIFEGGTIGGIVAMNSIGFMGGYGNVKEWIEEIEFVNGRGEVVKIRKADLDDVCGMEGITGVIIKVKLRLIPLTKKSASIFQTEEIEEIFAFARRLRLDKEVVMLRFYSPYASELLGFPKKYNLIIGFNSDRGKVKGEEYKDLLKKIKKDYCYFYSDGYYDSEDPKFFFDKLGEFVSFLDVFKIPYFGDLNIGIIYTFFKENIKRERVVKMIRMMNGQPGKYGIGLKRKYLLDNLQKKIIKRIKLRYDPFEKLNKGKVIDFVIEKKQELNKEVKKKGIAEEEMGRFIQQIEKKEKDEEVGNVSVKDNLDRKINVSEDDINLIDKIMPNKTEEEKKENEGRGT